jgi:glycolate oxidase iron-sulfur subunit
MDQLRRKILLFTVPNPGRFRLAVLAGRLARPFQRLIPAAFRPMLDLVPVKLPPAYPMSETYPAEGQRRARVALLSGCAQQVLAPEINKAMLRVLAANGVEVVVPRKQACCGALALHVGSEADARASARQNLSAFPNDVDAILTNASGCGSGIHEYGLLFKGEPEEEKAKAFALRTLDICTFLDRLGLIRTPAANRRIRVAYHDACHLAHAQKERLAPRRILRSVEGIELVEPSEWELCCGSAGTYNLEQPEIARSLGRRKAENLFSTGAEWIATGNIGCLTQIKAHLRLIGRVIPIVHTVEILSRAYDRKLQ